MQKRSTLLAESRHPDASLDEAVPEHGAIQAGVPLEDVEVNGDELLAVAGMPVVVEEGVGHLVGDDP